MLDVKKNYEIEYLRAIAILMTLVGHISIIFGRQPQILVDIGNYCAFSVGVDLFFCISGYVVSKSLFQSLAAKSRGVGQWTLVKAFWVRRAFRLLPSAWFWLVLAVVLCLFFNKYAIFGDIKSVVDLSVAIIVYLGNDLMWGFSMIQRGIPSNLSPYWSLSMEEQFYFVYPLAIVMLPRKWLIRGLALLILGQFFIHRAQWVEFFNLTKCDAMAWGCLIYFFQATKTYAVFQPTFLKNTMAAIAFNILFIFLLMDVPVALSPLSIGTGMLAATSAVLVWVASYEQGYILPLGKHMAAALRVIGARSYTLYLAHAPVYCVAKEIWHRVADVRGVPFDGHFSLRLLATAGILLIIAVECLYRLLEKPLRNYGKALSEAMVAEETRGALAASPQSPGVPE